MFITPDGLLRYETDASGHEHKGPGEGGGQFTGSGTGGGAKPKPEPRQKQAGIGADGKLTRPEPDPEADPDFEPPPEDQPKTAKAAMRSTSKFCSRVRRLAAKVAAEYGVEPYAVIQTAIHLQQREKEVLGEAIEALRAVRKETGLTFGRISKMEDDGKDHANVKGLDVKARSLAGQYPHLGIGKGYSGEGDEDKTDHAQLLWDLLRKPDPVVRSQHDESLVREAAEMVKDGNAMESHAVNDDEPIPFAVDGDGRLYWIRPAA